MKIALIIPNNLWFCPYVKIYTDFLDKHSVSYDIISWNRDGKQENGVIQFNNQVNSSNPCALLCSYIRFADFAKKNIITNCYERLIIFTPQVGIFLSGFLKRKYQGKYIFDYRDLSIEQKCIFKIPFIKLLNNSFVNVISSPGFKQYLPKNYDFLISHNFDINRVKRAIIEDFECNKSKPIGVLTIGGIRDYESNKEVIDALANDSRFQISFVGKGPSAEDLKNYSNVQDIKNISFVGYYKKEEEDKYILNAHILNIFYPRKISHDTALSNRFYNSLILKKPMITTSGTIQGEYTEKYDIGLAVLNCDNLKEKIIDFLDNLDFKAYSERCNNLLKVFLADYYKWEAVMERFICK